MHRSRLVCQSVTQQLFVRTSVRLCRTPEHPRTSLRQTSESQGPAHSFTLLRSFRHTIACYGLQIKSYAAPGSSQNQVVCRLGRLLIGMCREEVGARHHLRIRVNRAEIILYPSSDDGISNFCLRFFTTRRQHETL